MRRSLTISRSASSAASIEGGLRFDDQLRRGASTCRSRGNGTWSVGNIREPVEPTVCRLVSLLGAAVVMCCPVTADAQSQLSELAAQARIVVAADGESGSALEDLVIQQLPWSRIAAGERSRIRDLLENVAQYRRLPVLQYEVEPTVYEYLALHPDVAVSTWRVMGISKVQMWQTGPLQYEAIAPDGSEGYADVVYRDKSQCLLLCSGTYKNVLIPRPITAEALLWLRYRLYQNDDGQDFVHQQTDVFLSFPSAAARTVAVLASPVTNVMMDRNLFEVSLYVRMMSQAKLRDPVWMEQVAYRMNGVLPQRRNELAELARTARPTNPDRTRTNSVGHPCTAASREMLHASLRRLRAVPCAPSAMLRPRQVSNEAAESPGLPEVANTGNQKVKTRVAEASEVSHRTKISGIPDAEPTAQPEPGHETPKHASGWKPRSVPNQSSIFKLNR